MGPPAPTPAPRNTIGSPTVCFSGPGRRPGATDLRSSSLRAHVLSCAVSSRSSSSRSRWRLSSSWAACSFSRSCRSSSACCWAACRLQARLSFSLQDQSRGRCRGHWGCFPQGRRPSCSPSLSHSLRPLRHVPPGSLPCPTPWVTHFIHISLEPTLPQGDIPTAKPPSSEAQQDGWRHWHYFQPPHQAEETRPGSWDPQAVPVHSTRRYPYSSSTLPSPMILETELGVPRCHPSCCTVGASSGGTGQQPGTLEIFRVLPSPPVPAVTTKQGWGVCLSPLLPSQLGFSAQAEDRLLASSPWPLPLHSKGQPGCVLDTKVGRT